MCGITGFFNPQGFNLAKGKTALQQMRDRLAHRGPDDAGAWLDAGAGIALGHRRLSIIDLSPAGHQPMVSASGRYVIIYNGEIYNYLELKKELGVSPEEYAVGSGQWAVGGEAEPSANRKLQTANGLPTGNGWRGKSDTEVLLKGIEKWGLESTLKKCVGMFAFALWDRQERVLTLVRDRMGEKPLYYGWQRGVFLFGSELKALRAHPSFESEIDRDVLPLYIRHGYIPAPWSIWKNIHKLEPGTWISITAKDHNQFPKPKQYWLLTDRAIRGQSHPYTGPEHDAVDQLEGLLKQSISSQMVADVPLGAFLSGGIDSSLVVALMQAQSLRPVKTFTIGFDESRYNEAEHAKAVAKYLGTDHTELYVTHDLARQVIPLLPQIYDEPFADHSGIPTFLVSQLARQHVTVSLSGDGGDELFGGYTHYSTFDNWFKKVSRIPYHARKKIAFLLKLVPLNDYNRFKRRVELMTSLLEADHPAAFYNVLKQNWLKGDQILRSLSERPYWNTDRSLGFNFNNHLEHAQITDMMTYLPDDILVKVDRAAMANSLETRIPLLDHRIVEFSLSLSSNLKTRSGHEKWVLRELLYKHVPQKLVNRPKMGFSMPLGQWLKGPLKEWAEDLIDPAKIEQDEIFNLEPILRKWKEHTDGITHWDAQLWPIFMFQAWIQENKSS